MPARTSMAKVLEARQAKVADLKALAAQKVKRARASPRLYMKGTMQGYRRGLHGQRNGTAILRIDDVVTIEGVLERAAPLVALTPQGLLRAKVRQEDQLAAPLTKGLGLGLDSPRDQRPELGSGDQVSPKDRGGPGVEALDPALTDHE